MTKISQIAGVSISISDTDIFEKEMADGTSQQFTGLQIKNYIMASVFNSFILRSQGPQGHRWKLTVDDTGQSVWEDLGV